jgi:hypothetical protein
MESIGLQGTSQNKATETDSLTVGIQGIWPRAYVFSIRDLFGVYLTSLGAYGMTTSIRHTTSGIQSYSDGKTGFPALLPSSWFTIGTQTSKDFELSLVERHGFISGCRLRGRDSLSCKTISITSTILPTYNTLFDGLKLRFLDPRLVSSRYHKMDHRKVIMQLRTFRFSRSPAPVCRCK